MFSGKIAVPPRRRVVEGSGLKNAKAAKPIEYLVAMHSYDHLPDMVFFSKCWRVLLSCIQQYSTIGANEM
jgi:hypothetical protein